MRQLGDVYGPRGITTHTLVPGPGGHAPAAGDRRAGRGRTRRSRSRSSGRRTPPSTSLGRLPDHRPARLGRDPPARPRGRRACTAACSTSTPAAARHRADITLVEEGESRHETPQQDRPPVTGSRDTRCAPSSTNGAPQRMRPRYPSRRLMTAAASMTAVRYCRIVASVIRSLLPTTVTDGDHHCRRRRARERRPRRRRARPPRCSRPSPGRPPRRARRTQGLGVGDGVAGPRVERRALEPALLLRAGQRGEQHLPGAGPVGRQPVPHPAEDREHVVALEPLDVDHLEPVEHGHVDHLAGRVPQRREHGQRGLVQVDVLGDRRAELVERQPQPVLPRRLVLLEQPLRLEGGHQSVRGALAEAQSSARAR